MFDGIIQWSLKNRWLVLVFGLVVFTYGILSSFQTPVDVFPDFAPVQVVVKTEAPGFAPIEVESQITIPLESELNGVAKVDQIRSLSNVGLSVLTLIFEDGTDVFTARQLVAEKLQTAYGKLPPGVEQPQLSPISTSIGDVLKIGLVGETTSLMELRTLADWTIYQRLMAINGVTNIVIYGGEVKQYQVLVNPNKLKEYNISLDELIHAVNETNLNMPGGILRTPDKEYIIRGLGLIENPEEIANSVITSRNGVPILIRNIAKVEIGSQQKIGDALVNGKRGIILQITKQPWANTLKLTYEIERALKDLKKNIPKDVSVHTTFRQADFIETAIHNVLEALILGSILVIIILFAFLQNWRTAFISLTAIPLSLLAAIIVLKWSGGTINTMTLGGLAIAIGEVVDDAIIDVENVYRRLRENLSKANPEAPFKVVLKASKEIRGSVVYATFIIALVFLPIFSLTGIEGKIFTPLGFSFIAAILSSLAVALSITPALCFLLLKDKKELDNEETNLIKWLKNKYTGILSTALRKSRLVIIASVLLLLISFLPFIFLGKSFLPEFDEGNLVVVVNSSPGTSLDVTTQTGKVLTKHMVDHKDVVAIGQRAGRAPGSDDYGVSNFSEFDLRLNEGVSKNLITHIRTDFSKIPGIVVNLGSYISHRMDHVLSGVNAAIAIKVFGSDLDVLYKKAYEIEKILKTVKGAVDVQVEQVIPIPQIAIKINRDEASKYGLTVGDLARTIEVAYKGKSISKVIEGQRTFDLVVWFDSDFRQDVNSIKSILIDTPRGVKVPISSVASIDVETTENTIRREDVSRRVVIQANVFKRDISGVVNDARKKIEKEISLPDGYYINYGGQFEAQEKASRKLIFLSLVVILGIYLLLVMAFKSLKAALLVMVNLPLALIGGIWAIVFSGGVLSVGSLIGFITLFGISTRNGIMLVSHFKNLIEENRSLDDAIFEGSLNRLSPVLMTALTAALGVLPIAIMGGAGRELEQPLAVVILGGMISSTCLTLIVVPVLFKVFGKGLFVVKNA